MRIFAIDPGPTESAFGFLVDGVPVNFEKQPNHALLSNLSYFGLNKVHIDAVVVEMVTGYGIPAGQETFDTCVWVGRFIQEAGANCLPWFLASRKQVKSHLCGTTTAKDKDVREALIGLYGPPGKKKTPGITYGFSGDMWAALAVARYFQDNEERLNVAKDFGFNSSIKREVLFDPQTVGSAI